MHKINLPVVVTITAVLSASTLFAETTKTTREFRPLEATKVAFAPSAQIQAGGVDATLAAAWKHFDEEEWSQAIDNFLTVMERDGKNASAAEGLAMSVYRSKDYKAAYRLCVEFADFMPDISEKIAAVVLFDVRLLIGQEKSEAARKLLDHFPKSDLAFTHAHTLVEGAGALAQYVGPDQELPTARLAKY